MQTRTNSYRLITLLVALSVTWSSVSCLSANDISLLKGQCKEFTLTEEQKFMIRDDSHFFYNTTCDNKPFILLITKNDIDHNAYTTSGAMLPIESLATLEDGSHGYKITIDGYNQFTDEDKNICTHIDEILVNLIAVLKNSITKSEGKYSIPLTLNNILYNNETKKVAFIDLISHSNVDEAKNLHDNIKTLFKSVYKICPYIVTDIMDPTLADQAIKEYEQLHKYVGSKNEIDLDELFNKVNDLRHKVLDAEKLDKVDNTTLEKTTESSNIELTPEIIGKVIKDEGLLTEDKKKGLLDIETPESINKKEEILIQNEVKELEALKKEEQSNTLDAQKIIEKEEVTKSTTNYWFPIYMIVFMIIVGAVPVVYLVISKKYTGHNDATNRVYAN